MQIRGARLRRPSDLPLISSLGAASGYLSVLVLALYIQDAKPPTCIGIRRSSGLPVRCCFYWVSRTWLIAHRGTMHDDPIVFAARDRSVWL